MSRVFKERLRHIIARWVGPLCESHGFRKTSTGFVRSVHNVAWVVETLWSKWNDATQSEFTVECGIYVPHVTSVYFGQPEPQRVRLINCCIQARLGMLSNDRRDKWWSFKPSDDKMVDDGHIGEDVTRRMEAFGLPFLMRFPMAEAAMDFLGNPRAADDRHVWPQSKQIALCYAGCIAAMLGRQREMQEYLRLAVHAAKGSPIEDVIMRVKDSLERGTEKGKQGPF